MVQQNTLHLKKSSLFFALLLPLFLLSLILTSAITAPQAIAACSTPEPTTAAGYEQLIRNTTLNGRWYHGDSGQSVVLPDGKKLFVFGDTLSGTVDTNGTQNWANHIVNNSGILTEQGCSTVLLGPNDANGKPTSWVTPTGTFDLLNLNDYYWASTPFMDGSDLRMFLTHMYNDSSGFHVIGTDLATFNVASGTPQLVSVSLTPSSLVYNSGPTWGAAVIQDGDHTYIFGNHYKGQTWVFGHHYYLARVPNGQITDLTAWRYWTGSTWSALPTDAAFVINGTAGVGSGATVYKKSNGTYVIVSKKYDFIGTDLVAWTASSLTGPWTQVNPALLAPVPNVNSSAGEITYLGLAHPWATLPSGKLLVSWSLNSSAASFFGNPRYGIYFAEVTKP